MSIGSLEITMARIKTATPQSPISVFVEEKVVKGKKQRVLDARFANTVDAVHRKLDYIKPRSTDGGQTNFTYEWIGDYHRWNTVKTVRALLKQALEK
jgi:hypothetical protein